MKLQHGVRMIRAYVRDGNQREAIRIASQLLQRKINRRLKSGTVQGMEPYTFHSSTAYFAEG